MSKVNCCVKNCSHHQNGICYANIVTISGSSAETEGDTCCSAFLNQATYSKLTDNTQSYGQCESLVCKVDTCTYNENSTCQLDSIVVAGENPMLYTETSCASYLKR